MKTDTRLVLLCDYGLDDAVASLFMLKHKDLYKAIDVFAVAGNVSSQVSLVNAINIFKEANAKVNIFSTNNIIQNYVTIPHVHGKDGIGDILNKYEGKMNYFEFSEWYKLAGNDNLTILSLGPCTVTQVILENIEHSRVKELILMGGFTKETPNYKDFEFNQGLDQKAFNYCIQFPEAITVTLDTCRKPCFNLNKYTFSGDLFHKMLNRAIELAVIRHPDNAYIYDLTAAVNLIYKTEFSSFTAKLENETEFLESSAGFDINRYLEILSK